MLPVFLLIGEKFDMRKTISDFLVENKRNETVSFHMPGHKGRLEIFQRAGYAEFFRDMLAEDITEIPGADALFCPQSTILAVMEHYASLYGVRHTELLINGASAGVIAAILACVPRGGKLILGRNSHHAAFSALRLGGIEPVYLRPLVDPIYGLQTTVSHEELTAACEENPDASAVLITSPNYYGMLSDIEMLSNIAHEFNKVLIVDQAHGAHLRFMDYEAEYRQAEIKKEQRELYKKADLLKTAAEGLGADITVNSTHKTLFSFTGTGILNICSDRVDSEAVSETLKMIQTTSPSYLLMGSLDINEKIMRKYGIDIIRSWISDIKYFYKKASKISGLTLVISENLQPKELVTENTAQEIIKARMDPTKINISMSKLGISGEQLERELRYKGIVAEMVHGEYVMLLSGAGNNRFDYDKLLAALESIADGYGIGFNSKNQSRSNMEFALGVTSVPEHKERIPLYASEGRVLYDPIITYPPGSPIACPGEIMNIDVISYIANTIQRGEKVSGVDEEGQILVGM